MKEKKVEENVSKKDGFKPTTFGSLGVQSTAELQLLRMLSKVPSS